jgi:ankyrin repeat protein
MLGRGINSNLRNPLMEDHETALHMACRLNFCEMTHILLEKGAIANVQDKNKVTPLHFATKNEC